MIVFMEMYTGDMDRGKQFENCLQRQKVLEMLQPSGTSALAQQLSLSNLSLAN